MRYFKESFQTSIPRINVSAAALPLIIRDTRLKKKFLAMSISLTEPNAVKSQYRLQKNGANTSTPQEITEQKVESDPKRILQNYIELVKGSTKQFRVNSPAFIGNCNPEQTRLPTYIRISPRLKVAPGVEALMIKGII